MANERYALFGVIQTEREVNPTMTLEEQNIGDSGDVLIYETDDRAEAQEIYRAGGFERDGVWNVVTRVEDRMKRMGARQEARPQPSKRDYDQS